MGIGLVLLVLLCLGAGAAAIGSSVLSAITATATRGRDGREKVIRFAKWLPKAFLLWWIAVFVFQAAINDQVFHTDPGIGDSWYVGLPNGYKLGMIDVTDSGWVTKTTNREMGQKISELQIAGRYILGRYEDTKLPHPYFLLDTATDRWQALADLEALRATAKELGIQPALEPINDVYGRYRSTWFYYFTLLLYLGFPIAALILLAKRVRGVRGGAALAAA